MLMLDGQEPESVIVVETRATLAAVPLRLIVPVASGVGRLWATPDPAASCTRKYFPGSSRQGPLRQSGVTAQLPVPVSEISWTDQPVRSTVVVPRLKISIKSFLN